MTCSTSRLTIEKRIQALAQELQDQILESTLIGGVKQQELVAINKSYKPPWQLSVNRITRTSVTQAYYGTSIFQIEIGHYATENRRRMMRTARKWLASLPEGVRSGISQLRFNRYIPALPACSAHTKRLSLPYQEDWYRLCYTLPLDCRRIKLDLTLRDSDGVETTHWVDWDGAHTLLEAENWDRMETLSATWDEVFEYLR